MNDLGDDLPDDLRGRIKAELLPGERLLWAEQGQPREPNAVGLSMVGVLAVLGLFAVGGICLATFFGLVGPPKPEDRSRLFALGASLALIGGLIALAWSYDRITGARRRRQENRGKLYALTDRRAVVWVSRPQDGAVEVHSLTRGKVLSLYRVEYPDGTGDVQFGTGEGVHWNMRGFEGVAEVRRVEDLVRRTLIDPGPSVG